MGPTVIIAARVTWDGGRRPRGPVDSLRRALDTSSADIRAALAKRGVTTFVTVSDSFVIARDSGSQVVMAAFGDSLSYVLVSRDRPPRLIIEGRRDLLGEVDWYLFTNEGVLDHAVKAVRHQRPSEFPQLPALFVQELDSLGCTIPESWGGGTPPNVITGSFARRGQTDWAVICARQGKVGILVFWGGTVTCPREIFESREEKYLVAEWGATRQPFFVDALSKADSNGIANIPMYGLEPDLLAARKEALSDQGHDGIEYSYEEKGSTVWYCTGGQWMSLGGGD